jgi:hypothetical protein
VAVEEDDVSAGIAAREGQMRKTLTIVAVMALGTALATPVLADHHGPYRGHHGCYARGGYHTAYYAPYPRPVYRSSLYFGFGAPVYYGPAPAYVYAPGPVMAPAYGYYQPVWVPGHYGYGGGARFWISGYWSH